MNEADSQRGQVGRIIEQSQRNDRVFGELPLVDEEPDFEFTGKRGKITLRFNLLENGEKVGSGEKHMLVSGIRDYCQATVDDLISFYNQRKESLKPA